MDAAWGLDAELDRHIWLAVVATDDQRKAIEEGRQQYGDSEARFRCDRMSDGARYTASLDAAMTLVPEGWHVGMLTECAEDNSPIACLTENEEPCRDAVGKGVNMTLSLVAAALRAREEDRG